MKYLNDLMWDSLSFRYYVDSDTHALTDLYNRWLFDRFANIDWSDESAFFFYWLPSAGMLNDAEYKFWLDTLGFSDEFVLMEDAEFFDWFNTDGEALLDELDDPLLDEFGNGLLDQGLGELLDELGDELLDELDDVLLDEFDGVYVLDENGDRLELEYV